MKKRFLFVLALLSVLTITGCKESVVKKDILSAPQQIMVQSDGDKSLIIFDEVKNAQYYDVYINDVCVTIKSSGTGTIQFDASKIITSPKKYTIKVKAGGDNYFDSDFTQEYEYNHTGVLDAPVVTVDGTTLNWNKVPNAEFYDVVVTSLNPTIETVHRFPTNSFDFTNILANKGEYLFKVRAISESGDYLPSIYSNQVKYTHKLDLITPYNLSVKHEASTNEMLLSFVSSENVDNFTINIDGNNYSFAQTEMSKFLYPDDLGNMYIIRLTSFAKYKGVTVNNATLLNVSVKANTSNEYLRSSDFSSKVSCQFVSVLETPRIELQTNATTCKIRISATTSTYLSGFAIYLNDQKYKTLARDVRLIELPLTEISTAGIRVQAISNNNNCYSSKLSDVKYATSGLSGLGTLTATYSNGTLSWGSLSKATTYYVEILNDIYRYAQFTNQTSLNISSLCDPGKYSVRITAMGAGYRQSEAVIDNIEYLTQLATPENMSINTIGDSTYLHFDQVDNADGYLLYLNGTVVNKLFVGSPININSYISEANSYNVKIKAIAIANQYIKDSNFSTEQVIQSVKTLSAPSLTIVKEDEKYYLNVYVDEAEKGVASNYEIWINYQSIGEQPFQNAQIDITSYFTNAGQYTFMIKAKAIDSPYIKDSNMSSITYNCIKQLETVTDIKVTKLEGESTYILTFKEQTLAAKYLVRIVKDGDEQEVVEYEVSRGVVDISQHVVANGVYKVYVKALALEGSFYTDSATSGNPYRLTKGESLSVVENITVDKQNSGEILLSWDSVANSSGYQVYVYYNGISETALIKSIFVPQATNPVLNIGSGKSKCLNKEGSYSIQIKALGDEELYETSQTATLPYIYVMESVADFERNTVIIYGNTVNYKVATIDDLKNLLWYHYLYNEDVWLYNTLEYNLKVYCDVDLNILAGKISDSIFTQVESKETNVEKMDIIANFLLQQYPEISNAILGINTANLVQDFCLNEQDNVYLFRYQDGLGKNKTQTIPTSNQVYKEKLDIVDTFDQRSATYVFAIDTQETVDVTTTEQLFMALQYNKKPNFVGDCAVAKAVYENARFVLRQICADNMSEYEKTLQIYDFLTKRITWNDINKGDFNESVTLGDSTYTLRGNLKDFYLEGILYNASSGNGLFASINEFIGQTGDSAGLAKAFVVLCSIEGIDAIKVNGKTTTTVGGDTKNIDYSWNKVYIDIEEDGIEGKRWYAIDLARAIKNIMDVTKSGITTTYQVALHKYFLITDTKIGIQSTSLHKRLGDSTDYVADTSFDYYANQRYSCVYNSNTIVDNDNFKAVDDTDVTNALMYAMLTANKKQRVVIDIDAGDEVDALGYITKITGGATDEHSLTLVTNKIKGDIYQSARTALGGQYNCSLTVTIIDARYIVIAVQAENYSE